MTTTSNYFKSLPGNFDHLNNQNDLQTLASLQLRPYPVFEGYLEQLREHLNFFPHDILFQVIPRAGQGYGLIRCLESGCSKTPIPLALNPTEPDCGRSVGFGGFAQFQAHILTHDFHEFIRDRRVAKQAALRLSSGNHQSSSESKSVGSNLETSDAVDVKPSLLSSPVRTTPISSETLHNPPPVPRTTKKCRIQEHFRVPGKAQTPIVIDVDSMDTNSMNSRSTQPCDVIDLDSLDSELDTITTNKSSKHNFHRRPKDDKQKDSPLELDQDRVWVDGEGLVPTSRFSNPNFSLHPPSKSRLSIAVSAISKSYKEDTQSEFSLPSIKPLSKDFDISGDKLIPRHRTHPIASSSSIGAKPFSGKGSYLSEAIANLSSHQSKSLRSDPYNFFESPYTSSSNFLHSKPTLSDFPFKVSGSTMPETSGFLDWHSSMRPGSSSWSLAGLSSFNESSDPLGMYDQIFSSLADVLPSNRSAIDMGMPYQEPQMRPEEIQDFYKRAVENIDFAHNTTVAEARLALEISEDEDARMDGLSVRLMPHQLIGVSWMVSQEKSKNSGGILADEMGLGKTVQMIATMVKNSSSDSKNKATLILAPLALLTQWKEEILDKISRNWKVMIYHPSFTKAAERSKIASNDVVITTLDTLRNEWADDTKVTSSKKSQKSRGLYNFEWYRVVIDEAQIIRNRNTKKSRAVCAVKATYRWCLTGTPIFNSLWDVYSYLRFLRIRPYNDMAEFREHISRHEKNHPNLATKRTQAVLATCMLRRQKDSKLDGQPLIVLPPKLIEDIMLDLSPDERDVYDMLEKKAQQKFNVFLKKGTVLKNFACILVLLLRLRQACGHPSLTIEEGNSETEEEGFSSDPTSELERALDKLGQTWIDNIRKKLQTETEELVEAEKENPSQAAAPECPICNDLLDDTARITKCGHVFCQACLEMLLAQADPLMDQDRNIDPKSVQKPCPNCRSPFCRTDTYLKKAFLPPAEDPEDEDETYSMVPRKMRHGVIDDSGDDEPSPSSNKLTQQSRKGKEKATDVRSLVPSTKLAWLLDEIVRVREECPTDKTIVVSQWTAMLSLCADFLRSHGYNFVRYQGDMKNFERDEAIRTFKGRADVPIMLMSLKCGGVGLNLTCANRVVSLDLAWSPASERQAFDRTHRLGQVKNVYVKRVLIRNTVEQRICELQRKKQDIADHALGEGTGKKLQQITVGELANLFNLNAHGEALS